MKPPFIVNESKNINLPGAIDVFGSVAELERYLEPWYVKESHFIFDGLGQQLEIETAGHQVHLKAKTPTTTNPELTRTYLISFLESIAEAKGWNYVGRTPDQVWNATLDWLSEESLKFLTK